MELVVLADTHLSGAHRALPGLVLEAVDRADGVLHAGDLTDAALLDDLMARGPVWAVLGNNDHGLESRLPQTVEIELARVRVAMIHDAGPKKGREARMARRFPNADVVVFGHSHEPVDALGVGRQRLFNPGSPTQRRRQPHPTFGRLVLEGGRVVEHHILRADGGGEPPAAV